MDFKTELLQIISMQVEKYKHCLKIGEEGEKRNMDWVKNKRERDRKLEETSVAITRAEEGSWVEQLTTIIKQVEQRPEWSSTLKKLQFGNQVEIKRLGGWNKQLGGDKNCLIPVAILQDLMSGEKPKTLKQALLEATSPGIKCSKYNWTEEDLRRLKGTEKKEKKRRKEVEQEPAKKKRKRGEDRVRRVMKTLAQALKDGVAIKANGRNVKTLSELNLDRNGVSYSSAVTRNLYTPGNKTTGVHFFKKSLTTIYEKEPEEMKEKIKTLLKEGKTQKDAENEILKKAVKKAESEVGEEKTKGDEKEEKDEDYYMKESSANTKTHGKPTKWRRCNLCKELAGKTWEIQESSMQRHLKNWHSKTLRMEMLEVNRNQNPENRKRNEKLVSQLTPVMKIQHSEPEEKRELKHLKPLEADMRYKIRYTKMKE